MAIEPQSSPAAPAARPVSLRSASARDRLATLFPDPSAPAAELVAQAPGQGAVVVVVVALIASLRRSRRRRSCGGRPATGPRPSRPTTWTRSLNGVAVVEPVSQASVAFPAAGTVASVNVKVGDSVTVGQALASLDPQALTQTLHEKQATLAQAQLTLQKALNGESVSGVGSGSTGTGSRSSLGRTAARSAAHQQRRAAHRDVDPELEQPPDRRGPAGRPRGAAEGRRRGQHRDAGARLRDDGVRGRGHRHDDLDDADRRAADRVPDRDQGRADRPGRGERRAQQQLVAASTALDTLLTQQATTRPRRRRPRVRTGTDSTGSGRRGVEHGSGPRRAPPPARRHRPPTSIAYQKAVDAAEAEVAVAEQAIAQATIVSPIAGTVQAVNLAVGDSVTAGSTTANIVVVGAGGYEVTTTVSVDEVSDVKVGQHATVVPDGSKQALDGTVTAISIAPDNKATTTSYRVVIGLTDQARQLDNGSTGSVGIVTESSRAALAVPTSAVTTVGNRHTVTVLDGTTTRRVLVQVGVIGDTWTEITGGVTAGQKVVLADLGQPLPGSATTSSSSSTNQIGPRGFPGGGPPGGFTGGRSGQ